MRTSSSCSSLSVVQCDGVSAQDRRRLCRPLASRARRRRRRAAASLRRTRRPVSCRPIGRRSAVNPHGTLIAGRPARLALTVKTSARYICSGSSTRSPIRKAGVGLVGIAIDVDAPANALLVVAPDQRAHLLRLQIVGVVVAGAQHVGAQHDAALDLGAEPCAARRAYIVRSSSPAAGSGCAKAVAHAVVARQVRARLGGGHQVVDRDRVPGVRQLDVDQRRAARAQRLERRVERARDTSPSTPSFEQRARHADRAAPRTSPVSAARVVGHRLGDAASRQRGRRRR